MSNFLALLFGLLFGAGLLLSGMTDPARVIGFLDVAGAWNLSLAFVMGGAVLTAAPIFALARPLTRPPFGAWFETPDKIRIDSKLVVGAAIFGIGWGLAGLCPGPALVNLGLAPREIWFFVGAMALGLVLGRFFEGPRRAWGRTPDNNGTPDETETHASAS